AYYGVAYSNFPATLGRLYVPDAATDTVRVFESAGGTELEPITGGAAPPGAPKRNPLRGEAPPRAASRALVDSEALVDAEPASPSYGHLYVLDRIGRDAAGEAEGALEEFDAEGHYRGQIKGFVDTGPSGIAIEAGNGNVLVTSGGPEGSAVFRCGPTAPAQALKGTEAGTGAGTVRSAPAAGIACGGACTAEFTEGERVELFAAPDAHSAFKGWSGGGCIGTGSCAVLMGAAAEVQAEFEEPTQQTLTVSMTGAGEGTVTSEPAGLSCPGRCTEHFNQGRLVTLTAAPAPGSRFAGWSGGGCAGVASTCRVTMSEAKGIAADFGPIPALSLAVSIAGTGVGTVTSEPAGISCPGRCAAGFGEGSRVTLIASAAPGSNFAGWSGGCSGVAAACTLAIGVAQSLGAEFDLRPAAAPPGAVGTIPCESDECAPLPVAPEDPTVGTLVPGASNPPVHFPPKQCPKGSRRVSRKGKVACVAPKHHKRRKKKHK